MTQAEGSEPQKPPNPTQYTPKKTNTAIGVFSRVLNEANLGIK